MGPWQMRGAKRGNDRGAIHAFAGACLLTGAILLPHARVMPILTGMGLAGLIRWTWASSRNSDDSDSDD